MYNNFFKSDSSNFNGIAHRKKQHRYTSQLTDVLVDSTHPCFYQAIECKGLKEDCNNKIYFSSHFSENDEGHQIERMKDFCERSGRAGYLAVEIKRGRGKPKTAYLIPWTVLESYYYDDMPGISLSDLEDIGFKLERDGSNYVVNQRLVAWLQKNHDNFSTI